jgi:hypothetical protein
VELSGRVRLVGSEPFPELVITDAGDQDWYIESASRRTLQPYEQRSLTIRGKVELIELILANGYSLGIRRILSDVTVIDAVSALW